MLRAGERHHDRAVVGRRLADEDAHVARRFVEHRAEHLVADDRRRPRDQEQIDVLFACQAHEAGPVGRDERGRARHDAARFQSQSLLLDRARGEREVGRLRDAPRHDQLAGRPSRERLRDGQERLDRRSARGTDEDQAVRRTRSRGHELGVLRRIACSSSRSRRAGLDPELVDERPSRLVVCGERIGLTTRAVERQHQLRTQVLTQRLLGDQLLELGDEIVLAPERQVRLDAQLERDEPELLEPVDRRLGERLVREVL